MLYPRFEVGFLLGIAALLAVNTLTQSPTIFLSFFAGAVVSGVGCTGLFCWVVFNGYISVCQGMAYALVQLVRNGKLHCLLDIFVKKPEVHPIDPNILRFVSDCCQQAAHGPQGPPDVPEVPKAPDVNSPVIGIRSKIDPEKDS